ncbi:MAG: LytTR family DNA-binding domain-containing protein [Erythrobacter sp.]|nr:LytTR family DNA-binding domain-containing protein [Erythrobacter sp.]
MTAQATPPHNRLARKLVIDLSIMTVIGVVLAFIGPFGSFQEPLAYRLFSWVTFAWVGYAIYSPMNWLVDRLQAALDLPRPALWGVGVAVATIPMTAIVWSMGFLPRPVPLPTLEQAMTSYFYVFLVGGGITAFFYMIETGKGSNGNEPLPGPSPSQRQDVNVPIEAAGMPRLIERLPPALGSDVIALEMEDHYVRVHTALGSELVLMRLRDAIAELEGIDGHQVHRSWWVARGAVEDVVREGRNVRLKLARELEAPVARAQVGELRDAGWI